MIRGKIAERLQNASYSGVAGLLRKSHQATV